MWMRFGEGKMALQVPIHEVVKEAVDVVSTEPVAVVEEKE
jgi:hypothetical protein